MKQVAIETAKSDRQIAREQNVAIATVAKYRRLNGIKSRPERRREAFARLYDTRLTPSAIMERMSENGTPISRPVFFRLQRQYLTNH